MRQHVNPLSKNFDEIEKIPSLDLALVNTNWNYLGIEIRERLVKTAKLKVREREVKNLYFVFGNAKNILNDYNNKFIINKLKSISFNFPDPWFKKKHFKRRVIQPEFINILSNSMEKGSLIFVKTDVSDLFTYMDETILSNFNFKKIDQKNLIYSQSFNPNKFQTNREKYVVLNGFDIFESIYIKI